MGLFSHIDKLLSRLTEDEIEKWLRFHDELDRRYSKNSLEAYENECSKYEHVQVTAGKSDKEKLKDYLYNRLMKDIYNDEGAKTFINTYENNGISRDAAIKTILEQKEIENETYNGWRE